MNRDTFVNCEEAQEFVSALYDGEQVPTKVSDHVRCCASCLGRLRAYSNIGTELRLLSSQTPSSSVVPSSVLERSKPTRLQVVFGRGRILVPRFALAVMAGVFLVLTASLMRVHAQQSRPLWFEFQIDSGDLRDSGKAFQPENAVQAGYNDVSVWGDSPANVVGTHIAVANIKGDSVQLAVRARRYSATNADQIDVKKDLGDLSANALTYYPGQSLAIPIEGGGTLQLTGYIVDHQPKFMPFGIPLEPGPNQLILSSPVLITDNRVLANLQGANTIATGSEEEALLFVPGTGLLRFALEPFAGAVKGVVSWGHLDFQLAKQKYSLLTASAMCSGDQPRTVWVKIEADFSFPDHKMKSAFLTAANPSRFGL